MCIHCCRLCRTPCPRIPYSCPHCPVRTISSCCPLGSFSAPGFMPNYSWVRGRVQKPEPIPCEAGHPRWLDVNREIIFDLGRKMKRTPETTHYAVIQLLHANYSKVLKISRSRRSYKVPLCGTQVDLFISNQTFFNNRGYIADPMAPESLSKLLLMIQDYIMRLRLLNKKFKWFGNGNDSGDILGLLGENDELIRLLKGVFGSDDLISTGQLLKSIVEQDYQDLLNRKRTNDMSSWLRSISDLYSEVTAAPEETAEETNLKSEAIPYNDINIPKKHYYTVKRESLSMQPFTMNEKKEKKSKTENRHYLAVEMPRLFFEPFDASNSATWMSRHQDAYRLTPGGKIEKSRVRHYFSKEEKEIIKKMDDASSVHTEKSFMSGEFNDMFGSDVAPHRSSAKRSSSRRSSKRRQSSIRS